jgi:flagellum-specific peptidoglycan hydrolase FlgJ
MKEKIFSALKVAILVDGKTSISDKTLNTYVDLISAQITDESQIATAIVPHVSMLKEMQSNINSVAKSAAEAKESELKTAQEQSAANEAAKKAAEEAAKAANGGKEVPEWQKAIEGLTKTVETLAGTVGAFNAEKTQQTLSQKLLTILTDEKKIPDFYFNPAIAGRTFKDEAEVQAFADNLGTQWEGAKQTLANQGFQDTVPPGSGDNDTKEIDSFVASIDKGTQEIIDQNKK